VPKPGLLDPANTPSFIMDRYKAQILFENVQIFDITDKEGNKLSMNNKHFLKSLREIYLKYEFIIAYIILIIGVVFILVGELYN